MKGIAKLGIGVGICLLILGACLCGGLGMMVVMEESTVGGTATPLEPTPTVRALPRAAPEGPSTADAAYLGCYISVAADSVYLMEDMQAVFIVGAEDAFDFCDYWAMDEFTARAARLESRHDGCPTAESPCLSGSRRWVADALAEVTASSACLDLYCVDGNILDVSLIDEAGEHLIQAGLYLDEAVFDLDRCGYD